MEHSRKQKLLVVLALVVAIASLSIGFAAFSVSLNVSSSANVTPNSDTFSVKFSIERMDLVVDDVNPMDVMDGASGSAGVINNTTNPTITNLSATFTEPGQYVHYKFYARNEGEYTAYLNSVNFLGKKVCTSVETSNLVQDACDAIRMLVVMHDGEYTETAEVSNHALPSKGQGDEIIIIIDYDPDGVRSDVPFMVTFPDVALVYSTVDDSSIEPTIVRLESGDLNTPGSIVSIGNEQFYVIGQENGNVKLLSMYNLHVGNSVDKDNNVTPLVNETGIQSSYAKGYVNGEYPFIGTTAFSRITSSYSGSIVEEYVNSYKTYLTNMGVDVSTARLITKAELENLGCKSDTNSCNAAPSWIYSTSYWSETEAATYYMWNVFSSGYYGSRHYSFNEAIGVRPVIEIPLSEFE